MGILMRTRYPVLNWVCNRLTYNCRSLSPNDDCGFFVELTIHESAHLRFFDSYRVSMNTTSMSIEMMTGTMWYSDCKVELRERYKHCDSLLQIGTRTAKNKAFFWASKSLFWWKVSISANCFRAEIGWNCSLKMVKSEITITFTETGDE